MTLIASFSKYDNDNDMGAPSGCTIVYNAPVRIKRHYKGQTEECLSASDNDHYHSTAVPTFKHERANFRGNFCRLPW